MAFDLGDYATVAERMTELKDKYPDARLRPLDPEHPYRIETIGDQTFIVVVTACYLYESAENPGVGMAWEPFPGKTNYTKDSELQNAETSAWGRAIVAALVADTKRGVASQDEVRNRQPAPLPEGWVSIEEHNEALAGLKEAVAAVPIEVRRKWFGYRDSSGYKAPYTKDQLDELDAQLLILSGDQAHRVVPTEGVDGIMALAAAECSLCGSTRTKRVLAAGGKARCADAKGCMERVETKAQENSGALAGGSPESRSERDAAAPASPDLALDDSRPF